MNITQDQVANYLQTLTPGNLPLPIFLEIARLTVTPIVEVVPLRRRQHSTEVLLLKRPAGDVWEHQYHTPGTVLRASDHSIQTAIDRILTQELHLAQKASMHFVEHVFHQVKRGKEFAIVYWIEVDDRSMGEFFPINQLPESLVTTQRGFITQATKDFQEYKLSEPRGTRTPDQ